MTTPLLSVVVCTYNRADILPICLQSLSEQTLSKSLYEVIVVDNNSTDTTRQIVESYVVHEGNFLLLIEENQGLSHARNRGCHEAKGEYVAYVDDDCKVPPSWGGVAIEVAKSVSPHVFGGPAYPFYNFVKPHWYRDEYLTTVAYGDQAKSLNASEHLAGMNITFRKTALLEVGGFLAEFGMSGNQIGYGEETEMVLRIRKHYRGALISYEPRLFLYHLARLDKVSLWWTAKSRFADGRFSYKLFGSHSVKTMLRVDVLLALVREIAGALFEVSIKIWLRDRKRFPFWQNYLYEVVFRRLVKAGTLFERFVGAV